MEKLKKLRIKPEVGYGFCYYLITGEDLLSFIDNEYGGLIKYAERFIEKNYGVSGAVAKKVVEKANIYSLKNFREFIVGLEIEVVEEWKGNLKEKLMDKSFVENWFSYENVEG